jgi:hypothetical protein
MSPLLLAAWVTSALPLLRAGDQCRATCTCGGLPHISPEAVRGAEVVVEGVSGRQRPTALYDGSHTRTVTRILLERVWKGHVADTVYVFSGQGGGDCGFMFTEGVRYILFLYRDPDGRLSTHFCSPSGPSSKLADQIAVLGAPQRVVQGAAPARP